MTSAHVQGTFTPAGGQALASTAQPATGQAGIYRVDQTVNGVHSTGGWVVGQSGERAGVIQRTGVPMDASHLDPTKGVVTVPDGTRLAPEFIGNNVGI